MKLEQKMCLLQEPECGTVKRFASGAVTPTAPNPCDDPTEVVTVEKKPGRKTKQPDWQLETIPRIIELPMHIDLFLDVCTAQLKWKLKTSQATRQILQELASQI